MTLSAADLDAACVLLVEQVRVRRVVTPSELADATPTTHDDVWAWLHFYGKLRTWLERGASATETTEAEQDALVTAALREVPIPVEGVDGLHVYPKSFEGMLQLQVLDAQLDRLTARLVAMVGDEASLSMIDGSGVQLANAVSYVTKLLAWAWTSEGYGLPFKATDPEPQPPDHITALGPAALLAITQAAHQFTRSIAACQALIDPTPAREGGRRPSWAAFFEALGSQTHIDARELAVSHSLSKVISLAHLAADRQRPARSEDVS